MIVSYSVAAVFFYGENALLDQLSNTNEFFLLNNKVNQMNHNLMVFLL